MIRRVLHPPFPADDGPQLLAVGAIALVALPALAAVAYLASVAQPAAATARTHAGGPAGRPLELAVTSQPVRPIRHAGRDWAVGELAEHFRLRPLDGLAVCIRAEATSDGATVGEVAAACRAAGAARILFALDDGPEEAR